MRRVSLLFVALAVGLSAAGCGGSGKLQTRGKVLKGGRPLTLPEGEYVRLTFIPVVEAGQKRAEDYYVAEYNRADGTFKVAGKDLKGMPPGKYKIMVEQLKGRTDVLRGAFSEATTPFVCEVKTAADEVVIDLDRKT